MFYMIIEHFRDGDPVPVYQRFRDHGRLAPEGLRYVASWVTEDFRRCFQIMECEDRALLTQWTARWADDRVRGHPCGHVGGSGGHRRPSAVKPAIPEAGSSAWPRNALEEQLRLRGRRFGNDQLLTVA